ncbi:MAG: helix-turn-helix domain-containing protein [Treponema sp.]|nr:helix-turn-helix domain-containing protein [Treponema sp.]
MNRNEKDCRAVLSRNIKRFRNRIGLSQLHLALELGISTTFLSDIETGKKWVSAQTLSKIAKTLKIEVYELFKPEKNIRDDATAAIARYLDDVDDALIKSIEEAVRPAVKRTIKKMHRYYTKRP